jgi:superfamily I DNA/RNA helicase
MVWGDVVAFYPLKDKGVYTRQKFEEQLHDNNFGESDEWKGLKETYFKLCQFYNAAGFADLILRATKALVENSDLNKYDYFIIDEYQDFNLAEETFINQLEGNPKGVLVVGDDEQILYENLKSSSPTLIRSLYRNRDYVKGMLAFCGRSSFHITKTADHFIQQHREIESIEKICLPLKTSSDDPKVQIIACATAPTAVDYIEKFITDYKAEINERKRQLELGEKKDAFLLILSPAKEVNFYVDKKFNGRDKLDELVSEYKAETRSFSDDYHQLLSYYSLATNPDNNFTFRKVLHYEKVPEDNVHELIFEAMRDDKNLCGLDTPKIKGTLGKCDKIRTILTAKGTISEKLDQIANLISVADKTKLQKDMEQKAIGREEVAILEREEEEEAEMEEIEVKKMGAVELMTIVGSKGLSADHVIMIGFDNVNMGWVRKNAFYVALTRARKSLHLLTALKSGGAAKPHSFLSQLPDDHLEFYKYCKGVRTKKLLGNRQCFMNYLDYIHRQSRRNPRR